MPDGARGARLSLGDILQGAGGACLQAERLSRAVCAVSSGPGIRSRTLRAYPHGTPSIQPGDRARWPKLSGVFLVLCSLCHLLIERWVARRPDSRRSLALEAPCIRNEPAQRVKICLRL